MRFSILKKCLALVVLCFFLSACTKSPFWESWGNPYDHHQPQHQGPVVPSHYKKADRLPPQYHKKKERCVTSASGQKVCGYDCKVVGDFAKCAKEPKQNCIIGPTGKIQCGYACTKTHSEAKCGRYIYDNCVKNHYGEIKCGNNCREREDGELVCGK